jgi:hypothetical protein
MAFWTIERPGTSPVKTRSPTQALSASAQSNSMNTHGVDYVWDARQRKIQPAAVSATSVPSGRPRWRPSQVAPALALLGLTVCVPFRLSQSIVDVHIIGTGRYLWSWCRLSKTQLPAPPGHGGDDVKSRRQGDEETRRRGDEETRRRGDKTRRQGDDKTRRRGLVEQEGKRRYAVA